MQLDPHWQAAFDRVGPIPQLIDELTDMITHLNDAAVQNPQSIQLLKPRLFALASKTEDARNLLSVVLGYVIPSANFSSDPLGFFISRRNSFERIMPTLDMTGDPETEMFKAILAGRN